MDSLTNSADPFTPQQIDGEVKQIQADIDALRNSPLSITTIRTAFEWWIGYTKRYAELSRYGDAGRAVRRKLTELDHLCAAVLCHFCEQHRMDTRSVKYGPGYKGRMRTVSGRMQWEVDADFIAILIKTEEAKNQAPMDQSASAPSGDVGSQAPRPDPYQQQRDFATAHLSAKERRIIELVCDHAGICPITDLAKDPAIAWQKPWDDAYASAQGRINRKCRKLKQLWTIQRRGNAATIKFLDRK
jgi:hypothetical protein